MKTVLVIMSLALAAQSALAAKPMYFVNGKQVNPEQALRAALDAQSVLSCKPVEAKVSKAGTSIGLRQVKEKK